MMEGSTAQQLNEHQEVTNKIFRVVYHRAKTMSSFRSYEDEILLQEKNGVNVGTLLHSRITCGIITDFLGEEMRKRMVNVILEKCPKFSILVDESDTVSKHATICLLYTSPSPRDRTRSRMPSSA